jgi:hypothetical protein
MARIKRAKIKRPKKGPHHDSSSTPKSISVIIIFFCIVSLLYFLSAEFFVIKTIDCIDIQTKQVFGCNHFVELKEKSLFFTDFERQSSFKQVVYADTKIYQVVSFKKELPGKLLIILSEKQLAYRIKIEDQDSYLVNIEGQIKEDDSNLELAEVSILSSWDSQVLADGKLDSRLDQFIQALLESLEKIDYVKVDFVNQAEIKIYLKGSKVAVLDYDADPQLAMIRLEMVLAEVDFESFETEIKEIDLRFNMPVLR